MTLNSKARVLAATLSAAATGVAAKPLEMTGWLVHWDDGASLRVFERHAAQMTRVAPGWYDCGADGLPERLGGDVVKPDHKKLVLQIARAHGVKVFALSANFDTAKGDFDADRVSKFLNDPALMRLHAQRLADLAKEDGADGVDLDYESLKGSDRDAFSRFAEALAAELHSRNMKLAIALHPKTREPGSWDGDKAQDWKRLGSAVDYFRPMAYDNHWPTSEAGPIAPLAWCRDVLKLALELVPPGKIELGVPAYGYDWLGKSSKSYDWNGFVEMQRHKGAAHRDPETGELTLKYEGREVWFADSQAMESKFALAHETGIRGLAMWRLGSEDPGFWERLQKLRFGGQP